MSWWLYYEEEALVTGTTLKLEPVLPLESSQTLALEPVLPLESSGLTVLSLEPVLPLESAAKLRRRCPSSVEFLLAGDALARRYPTAIEFLLAAVSVSRRYPSAVEWLLPLLVVSRRFGTPIEFSGLSSDSIAHIWNVMRFLDVPLLHQWTVLGPREAGHIMHTWNDLQPENSIAHRWRVFPKALSGSGGLPHALFDEDVQLPIADAEKS